MKPSVNKWITINGITYTNPGNRIFGNAKGNKCDKNFFTNFLLDIGVVDSTMMCTHSWHALLFKLRTNRKKWAHPHPQRCSLTAKKVKTKVQMRVNEMHRLSMPFSALLSEKWGRKIHIPKNKKLTKPKNLRITFAVLVLKTNPASIPFLFIVKNNSILSQTIPNMSVVLRFRLTKKRASFLTLS